MPALSISLACSLDMSIRRNACPRTTTSAPATVNYNAMLSFLAYTLDCPNATPLTPSSLGLAVELNGQLVVGRTPMQHDGQCLHEHAQWAASVFHVLLPSCDLLRFGGGMFYKCDHRILFSARDQDPQSPALGQRIA